MEVIYRGYPQGLAEYQNQVVPEINMQETKTMQSKAVLDRRQFRRENEYLKGLYPVPVRQSQFLVDEWFDQYEYPGSPVYDEYPDREWLLWLRDRIWNQAKEQGQDPSQELLYVLLISEIGRRRTAGRL